METKQTNQPKLSAIPRWLAETPGESYSLTMFGPGGESVQDIDLTRDEYIDLKQCLAEMRGIGTDIPETATDARAHLVAEINALDVYYAQYIEIALRAAKNEGSPTSPALTFIGDVLELEIGKDGGATPERVLGILRIFEDNWKAMVLNSKDFQERMERATKA